MKGQIIVLILGIIVLGQPAQAAKFYEIDLDEIANQNLKALAQGWREITDGVEDTGALAWKITSKKSTEDWANTIKQIHYSMGGNWIDDASAEKVLKDRKNLKMLVLRLVDSSVWIEDDNRDYAQEELYPLLEKVLFETRGVRIYIGHAGGDFGGYLHITVIDFRNQQIVSVIGGYAE